MQHILQTLAAIAECLYMSRDTKALLERPTAYAVWSNDSDKKIAVHATNQDKERPVPKRGTTEYSGSGTDTEENSRSRCGCLELLVKSICTELRSEGARRSVPPVICHKVILASGSEYSNVMCCCTL